METNRKISIISVAIAIFGALQTGPKGYAQLLPDDPALRSHIAAALRQSPGLAMWKSRVEAAEHQVPQAGAWSDPMFGVELMSLPVNTFSFNEMEMTALTFSAEQAIPLAGMPRIKTDIAKYNLESARFKERERELSIAADIAKTWYDWAYLQAAVATMDSNIAVLDDLIQAALRRYETGLGMQQDILIAQTRRSRMEDERAKMTQMALTTGRQVSVLIGLAPDSLLAPPGSFNQDFTSLSPDSLTAWLFRFNPQWLNTGTEVGTAQSRVELARREWWPMLTARASYGVRQDMEDGMARPDLFSAMVGVSVPIFGQRKQGEMVQEMRAMARMAQSDRRAMELEMRYMLSMMLDEDARLAQQMKLYAEGIIPQAEAALGSAGAAYAVGMTDFEMLLMAQMELNDARLERLERMRDRLQLRAALDALTGGKYLLPGQEG